MNIKLLSWKQFLNENKKVFKGYHCTDSNIDGEYIGKFNEYYYIHFPEILSELNDPISKKLELNIEKILYRGDKLKNNDELIHQIVEHLNNIGLEFIFVSDEPLTEYGDNCYKVYFTNNDYFIIDDWTGGKSASMICYFNDNKPILSL